MKIVEVLTCCDINVNCEAVLDLTPLPVVVQQLLSFRKSRSSAVVVTRYTVCVTRYTRVTYPLQQVTQVQ